MAQLNLIPVDFEFNKTQEEILNLVCCTYEKDDKVVEHWLHKRTDTQHTLKNELLQIKNENGIFLTYQSVAEARSIYSLGLNPMDFEYIDLFLEYRCLTNHNDNLMYGKQLVNGKVKNTRRPPPKWERKDSDVGTGFKPTHSLAEATYKLTGEIRDTDHKNEMRDLIISSPKGFNLKQKEAIQKYCTQDVVFLKRMYVEIIAHYKKLLGAEFNLDELHEEMLYRGKYAALTAIRESKGYPIDYEKTKAFSRQVPLILADCQRDINSQFPGTFKYNIATKKYSWNQKATKSWLEENVEEDVWPKTDKGSLSLSKDAFEKYFGFRHNYPRNHLGAQILRYLKLKQSLNGFNLGGIKKKNDFWDYVGSDERVRPYMNIYGSQSSRSQPKATGFIPLKPAWMRSLIYPSKGKAIAGLDYGSEEFFISALLSKDEAMIDAYLSGDVYLAFAKDAGLVPRDGKKEDYKKERNLCKATVLGMSYDMTCYGLARKLTNDTGENWTPENAQELIDLFEETYSTFMEFKRDVQDTYDIDERLQLTDGWYMFGDNDNKRSVGNFPIQGMGAAIMRKADLLCYENSLYVPFTLHDALYIEFDSNDFAAIDKTIECMREGFAYFFDDDVKDLARKIRIDCEVWSPDYEDGKKVLTPNGKEIHLETIHIDERSVAEYEKFSKFFNTDELELF